MKKTLLPLLLLGIALFSCSISPTPSTTSRSSDVSSEATSFEPSVESSAEPSQESTQEPSLESIPYSEPSVPSEPSSAESVPSSTSASTSGPKYARDPKDEPLYSKQSYLNYLGNIQSVWDEYRGDGVTLAVIDSGFRYQHAEFQLEDGSSKVLDTSATFTYSGGKVNVIKGRDKVGITDGDSHGTICATVAAGSINGNGTVGVAPNCNLMLLKTDKKPKSIVEAFKYAADNGARVITISIGSYADYVGDLVNDGSDLASCFNAALKYAHSKGVVICSASGNGGEMGIPTEYTFPGASDYVIGAGGLASNSRASIWSGSSYNSGKAYQFCDVFAPAQNLYSGCYFDRDGKHYDYDGGFNGTSFASPIIAGAAALYFQKYPTKTNVDFERALYRTASPLQGEKGGYGAIDIASLLDYEVPQGATKTYYFADASWWREDGANTSAFAWNYGQTAINGDYPGVKMISVNSSTWSIELDTTLYERLVFVRVSPTNQDWGAETVNIDLSSFGSKNCYSIASTSSKWKSDGQYVTGTFTTYNA